MLLKCLLPALVTVLLFGCSPANKKATSLGRADKYFAAGEFENAKVEYLNVLQLDPESAIAAERLGEIWFYQGAPHRALPMLLRARTQTPNNFQARTKLALVLVQVGKIEEARQESLAVVEGASAANETLVLLVETIRNPEDFKVTSETLKAPKFAQSSWAQIASAKLLLRDGKVPGASALLDRALRLDPKSPHAHAALAELHFREGNAAKAREDLKHAAELAPLHSAVRMGLPEFLVQTGAVPDAIAQLKELTRQAPDLLPPRRLLAQLAVVGKRYDEAQTIIREMFAIDTSNIDAHVVQAQLRAAKGELPLAIEKLETVRKANRGVGNLNVLLARLHLQDGHPERAMTVLDEGLAAHPEHFESAILRAELDLRAGKAQVAANDMLKLLRVQPGLLQAQNLLIGALRALGHIDDAIAAVREQLRARPNDPQIHVLLGTLLLQQKNPAGAKLAFERARELAPASIPALAGLVDLDVREKNFAAASQRIEELKKNNPNAAELFYLEATVHVAQQNWNAAETALHKTLELNPGFSSAYDLLLYTYRSNKKLPEAIRQLEGVLEHQPDNYRARMLTGMIYAQMNEYEKARIAYEKLIAAKPDTTALNNLAYLYSEHLNQLDRAFELAEKARTLDSESPVISDTLGWILFKRKEYPRSLELLRQSAAKLPDNPEVQFHLAMVSQASGETEAARAAFTKAASATVDFPGKSEIKKHLASLDRDSATLKNQGTK
jgi:tetratricopeptide (TPR) repeat protein